MGKAAQCLPEAENPTAAGAEEGPWGGEVMNCSCMGRHSSGKEQIITVVMNCMNHLEGCNLAPYVMCQYVENVSHPLG